MVSTVVIKNQGTKTPQYFSNIVVSYLKGVCETACNN
jgi:hypothetical protein